MNRVRVSTVRRLKLAILGGLGLLLVQLPRADAELVVRSPSKTIDSHIEIPRAQAGPDAKQLFEDRLRALNQRNAELEQLEERLRKLLGQEQWDELKAKFKNGELKSDDPRLGAELKKLIGRPGGKGPKLSEEDSEQLKKWFEKLTRETKIDLPNPLAGPANRPRAKGQGKDNGQNDGPDMPDEAARARAAEQIMRWARNLDRMAGDLEESPALRQALRDLSQYALDMQSTDLPPQQRLDTQLAQLNRYFQDRSAWWRDLRQALPPVDFPELPKLNAGEGSRLPALDRFPSLGAPRRLGRLPTGMSGGQQLLALLSLVLVALILWKLSGRLLQAVVQRGQTAGWKLGPWPLDPARIATRADVVRAFEYLSLLRLGYPARSWNHLEIAGRLGSGRDDYRQAALELAGLYERARYAPGNELLPADAIAEARRHVCFLAGLAGA